MVLPPLLRKRHTLRGMKILPVVKKIREGQPPSLKEYARIKRDEVTEKLSIEEVRKYTKDITGEDLSDLLLMAGKDDIIEEARWALHCIIIYANEAGQPKGQDLSTDGEYEPIPGTSSTDTEIEPMKAQKRKSSASNDLEGRVTILEKSAKVELVQELKEKVRMLCLQQEPSMSLILLTVEELAKTARKINHAESELYEELARQANRHQGKLDISSLCLSVLGGKAGDTITKAISKCLKEKQAESNSEVKTGAKNESVLKRDDSPLSNLYPNYPMPFMYSMPYQVQTVPSFYPGMYSGNNTSGPGYRNFRGAYRMSGFRPRGACLFCGSTTHQVKNCEKMKAAKGK